MTRLDTNFEHLRLPGRETYVIERILEYADLPAIRWLEKTFPTERIAQVVRRSRAYAFEKSDS